MMKIDLLRGNAGAQRARLAIEKRRESRRGILARYRKTEKHKEQQRRYLASEQGSTQKNAAQNSRRLRKPPPPMTEEQRARARARNRERAAERYRTDPEYRARALEASKSRSKLPKTPEQRERARKASRESMRRRTAKASREEKAAKYAATRAWRKSLSEEKAEDQRKKSRARWNTWLTEKYRTDPGFRAQQLNRCERRRALLKGSETSLSGPEWTRLCEEYQSCAYCGEVKPLTQDHVQPLARGGGHTIENVVPACVSCNAKKGILLPSAAFAKFGISPDLFWNRHELAVRKIRGES
jgi:5-methylcytosine-specific restriction endonuclease McrA